MFGRTVVCNGISVVPSNNAHLDPVWSAGIGIPEVTGSSVRATDDDSDTVNGILTAGIATDVPLRSKAATIAPTLVPTANDKNSRVNRLVLVFWLITLTFVSLRGESAMVVF